MLDRYKKKGGFHQLVQLIETSPEKKQEQFLSLIANESPVWEEALRKKRLQLDRIYSWDHQYLAEIFSRLQPLTLASALHGNPSEQIDLLLSCLPPISRRRINDLLSETNPSPAEKVTCMMKIISEVRGFLTQGLIKLEKVDPELQIPDNIEEILSISAPISVGMTVVSAPEAVETNDGNAQSEIDFYRRKCNQMASEVNALKHENSVLKDKLAQIKRIA